MKRTHSSLSEPRRIARLRKTLLFAAISILILILSAFLASLIHGAIYSSRLNLLIAPSTATIQIADQTFPALGEFEIQPGDYDLTITADGFSPKTGRLTVAANETLDLKLYLDPTSNNADYYDTHPEDALILGEIKASETTKALEALLTRVPALKKLPTTVEYYSDDLSEYTKYTLSYSLSSSDPGYEIIVKDYTGGNFDAARSYLATNLGLDLSPLAISYEDLSSDFLWGKPENP